MNTGRIPRNGEKVHHATSCKPFALAASAPPVAAATMGLQEEAAWSGCRRRGSMAGAAARKGAERERKRPVGAGLGETTGRGTRWSGSADAIAMGRG